MRSLDLSHLVFFPIFPLRPALREAVVVQSVYGVMLLSE